MNLNEPTDRIDEACKYCRKWVTQRVTDYEDGTRIVNLQTPEGKGRCEALGIDTDASFGCNQFAEGHEHVEIMGKKSGSPWHHSVYGKCPDCGGVGYGCRRCAGTGKVLYYDDGHIGEEQTRRHPNEGKIGPPPSPKCEGCGSDVAPAWVACPHCGTRTNKPDDPVRVQEILSGLPALRHAHIKSGDSVMSFCRWGTDSNVYVIGVKLTNEGSDKGLRCVGCDHPDGTTDDAEKFIAHLAWHREQGHMVPPIEDEIRRWTI